jgi:hypothetical protein
MAANSDEELADFLVQDWLLEPIEEDQTHEVVATEERERQTVADILGQLVTAEVQYAVVEVPLLPKQSNEAVLHLRSQTSLGPSISEFARFRQHDHVITLRVRLDDVSRYVDLMRYMFRSINQDIEGLAPTLRPQVLELVKRRREEVTAHASKFEGAMSSLGIQVKRKSNSVEPVNVQVKREIRVLRDKPTRSPEPYLEPDSLREIINLIGQAGRGFETTPSSYVLLGEEQLRDIIVNHLNAVFEMTAATGETFSKGGKTDIFLVTPGGAVLVAECKYWDGAKLYGETIDQLFQYLTWRHTVAVLITFSRNKSLTNVIEEAKKATQAHASFTRNLKSLASSYFTSVHTHPSDAEKTVEIHHLLFDLAV